MLCYWLKKKKTAMQRQLFLLKKAGWALCSIDQLCLSLWELHGLQLSRLLKSMEFSRQEYWNRLPCLPPGDLPDPGIKPRFPALQADSLPFEPPVYIHVITQSETPRWLSAKEFAANAGDTGDTGSIDRLERSPQVGNGNPLQYSCLENPMDRGAWQATVHRVTTS